MTNGISISGKPVPIAIAAVRGKVIATTTGILRVTACRVIPCNIRPPRTTSHRAQQAKPIRKAHRNEGEELVASGHRLGAHTKKNRSGKQWSRVPNSSCWAICPPTKASRKHRLGNKVVPSVPACTDGPRPSPREPERGQKRDDNHGIESTKAVRHRAPPCRSLTSLYKRSSHCQ